MFVQIGGAKGRLQFYSSRTTLSVDIFVDVEGGERRRQFYSGSTLCRSTHFILYHYSFLFLVAFFLQFFRGRRPLPPKLLRRFRHQGLLRKEFCEIIF